MKSIHTYSKEIFNIRYSIFNLFFLLAFLYPAIDCSAQRVYPILSTPQLAPPYSVYLADYAANEQLRVVLLQRDLTLPPHHVSLRMEVEWNGKVIIRTSPTYNPPPIVVDPGIPTVIAGADIYDLLQPANMEFTGYSRDQYMREKALPEGQYRIIFTVFDYTRPTVQLSSPGSVTLYLAKSQPPLLNQPFNMSNITVVPSPVIPFRWTPRNTSSGNSALTTEYLLELFEIRPEGSDPNAIAQNSRPVFTATVNQPMYTYTIADPMLTEDMDYAWRVRAIDTEGRDAFTNRGYSEVFSFRYGMPEGIAGTATAAEISDLEVRALSHRKAKATWTLSSDYEKYQVYYRVEGKKNEWKQVEAAQGSLEVDKLISGNVYEFRVQGMGAGAGTWSNTDTVRMPFAPASENCATPLALPDEPAKELLMELSRFNVVNAGGMELIIMEATGSNGRFSGKGFITLPFCPAKMLCEFTDLQVNIDLEQVGGTVRGITSPPGSPRNAIWDLDAVAEGGGNNGRVNDGHDGAAIVLPGIIIPGPEAISIDTTRKVIQITTPSGEVIERDISEQLEQGATTITVQDKDGNMYAVDTTTGKATNIGKATPAGGQQPVFSTSKLDNDQVTVNFVPSPNARFAYDKRNPLYATSLLFYEKYKTIETANNKIYDVPFKLIPVGQTDEVIARVTIHKGNIIADSIMFCNGVGTRYKAAPTGTAGEYLLTLPSGKADDGMEIFALYPKGNGKYDAVGKLIVVSYTVKTPKLVLVPVYSNTLDEAAVKEFMDKIYLPVGVNWKISTDPSFDYSLPKEELDVRGSGLFSQYTDGMKKINAAFINHKGSSYDASAIYIFIMQWAEDPTVTGDMPRNKQFGYVFTQAARSDQEIYRTIAHEVGHGIFHLKHTFDSQYQIKEKTTENLMDYVVGIELVKHQWDAIHEPGLVIGLFETDSDALLASTVKDNNAVKNILEAIRSANETGAESIDISKFWPKYEALKTLDHLGFLSGNFDLGEGMIVAVTIFNDTKNATKDKNIIKPIYNEVERSYISSSKNFVLLFKNTYDPKLVLRITVKREYYQNLGMYLFGSKWSNEFISSDKSWVLTIYSPYMSKSFKKAYNDNDLMEMRRLTYWALTHPMDNDYLDRYYEANCKISNYTGGYAARLQSNIKADKEGVTVYFRSSDTDVFYESIEFEVKARNIFSDAGYPVDINLYDGYDKPSLGTKFYDYDFKGYMTESSIGLGDNVKNGASIYGHLKGFGYVEYISVGTEGFVFAPPSISKSTIAGNYVATKGVQTPVSFEGDGLSKFIGGGIAQFSEWESYDKLGEILWKGKTTGFGISTSSFSVSGGKVKTNTTLIFPKISQETRNIFSKNYED